MYEKNNLIILTFETLMQGCCSNFDYCAAGDECEEPLTPLPTFLAADFETEDFAMAWQRVVGGQPGDHCGPVASRRALHFQGVRCINGVVGGKGN